MSKNNVNIDFSEDKVSEMEGFKTEKKTIVLDSAKRHAIKISGMQLDRNIYEMKSVVKTGNLVTQPTKSIAVFCNEYIPEHFPTGNYVKYILTVNGEDIEIVPINSNKNGIKRIKTSEYDLGSRYIKYINQPIKTAYLTIQMECPNKHETPFISNLKVLVGDKNV